MTDQIKQLVKRLNMHVTDKTKAVMQRDCIQAAETIDRLSAEVARLNGENDELRKDAERYRYLRDKGVRQELDNAECLLVNYLGN